MLNQKSLFLYIVFALSYHFSLGQVQYSHPAKDDEFVGPFPSWLNVKTKFGAVGNGIADDTHALQAAFDAIGSDEDAASVIYLPEGTYKISRTLQLMNKKRIAIVGSDPAKTKIKWYGETQGTMLFVNGVEHSHFNRITWDGSSSARIAVDQSWDGVTGWFDTGNEYADDVFTDVGFGIHGGFTYRISFAETAIMRCRFIRNSMAGVSLGNFNALDIWIWNSVFEDCAIGVTNALDNGAGGFKIYNSVFERSTIADIKINHTVEFSFRDNTSINSKAFIVAAYTPNPASIIIQGNKILDPVDAAAIRISNQGQITLLDNIIRSRVGAIGPVIIADGSPNSDLFAMGNTFTVANAIKSDKSIIYTSSLATAASLTSLTKQSLPSTQPGMNRKVFEVPVGASAAAIQAIIDQAANLLGSRPVVHLPFGLYLINTTIVLPAGSDIQLVGDSFWSVLRWSGSGKGPVIKIEGPTKATLQDLLIEGGDKADGILVTNADQAGSRIFTHQAESHLNDVDYLINKLDNTTVLLTNSGYTQAKQKGIAVIGGPLASTATPAKGKTIVYGGYSYDNGLTYDVSNGATLQVKDVWYESKYMNQFVNLSGAGNFSIEGSHIATNKQLKLVNFEGKATFLNSFLSNKIAISGSGAKTKLLGLGIYSTHDVYIADSTSAVANFRSLNTRSSEINTPGSGSYQVNDVGAADENDIKAMLAPLQTSNIGNMTALPAGVTDLRLYRVYVQQSATGIEFAGNGQNNLTVLTSDINSIKAFAEDDDIRVEWSSADETEIEKYEIERSLDGQRFIRIGSLNKGEAQELDVYSWLDSDAKEGSNYYRIRLIEKSGLTKYSAVVKVTMKSASDGFQIYPNPIQGNSFNLKFNNITRGVYEMSLINQSGQLLMSRKIDHEGGSNTLTIPFDSKNPRGSYVFLLKGDHVSYSGKLIK